MGDISRRRFLEIVTGTALASLRLNGRPDGFPKRSFALSSGQTASGFGPLVNDPEGVIDLPEGFTYTIISRAGERMPDGFFVPAYPDGMASFSGSEGLTILVRNHEIWPGFPGSKGAFGRANGLRSRVPRRRMYDWGRGGTTCLGSVTTLVYDTQGHQVRNEFLSLAGTLANCAGGPTPWNSWISCEEEFQSAGFSYARDHGYAFEVPASVEPGLVDPVPLKAMGRFVRESVAVHPGAGVIYQTEDQVDCLFYRFVPDAPGKLTEGGRLQALAAKGRPGFDTRNWDRTRIQPGEGFEVEWIDLDDIDSDKNDLRQRGFRMGAAVFAGGEGMFFHPAEETVYFDTTNGGWMAFGQIWRYTPSPYEGSAREAESPGRLELYLEPRNTRLLEHPDNLALTPWGDIFICEDGFGEQHLIGLNPDRFLYVFARNAVDESEFTGACFSPDGGTMFINIQDAGLTLAVTGPWAQ